MDIEHEERLTRVEERCKNNSSRLDNLEPLIEEIHNMSTNMVEMTVEMRHTNASISEIKGKVDKLESEPADKWKYSSKRIWDAILGSIGTLLAGGLLYILTLVK